MTIRVLLGVTLLAVLTGCGAYQRNDTAEGDAQQASTQPAEGQPAPVRDAQRPANPPVHAPREPMTRREIEEIMVTAARRNAPMDQALQVHAYRSAGIRAPSYQDYGRERYQEFENNGVRLVAREPESTFSIDVDTASYANVRRILNRGHLPPPDAVRVEELINYFSYDYPRARDLDAPFAVYTEIGPSPWDASRRLLHVGVNGWQEEPQADMPPANLVFLIDVSGSMQAPDKIDLLKSAMRLLVKQLRAEDRISIAVYAGASGQVLEPTAGDQKATIEAALAKLRAGGSTNGGAGIRLAYNLARQSFIEDGVNRVILATDGDFNVGTTDVGELERLVEKERRSGVALTVLGFGTGNYNDHLMQKIAQIGNGNAAYIDNINEARKVLVDELGATLNTIAKDVKIQVEFNPAVVESYRLIGYETRKLNREDFNNDKVDAGEIGAGHTVTALYELTFVGEGSTLFEPRRYANETAESAGFRSDELAYLRLRYKAPDGDKSRLIEQPVYRSAVLDDLDATSEIYRFSGAVAWLGQLLRNNTSVQDDSIEHVIELARAARGADEHGYRSEFINLARTAEVLNMVSMNALDQGENGAQEQG